ncbi:DinB family protein [Pseudalkalibacillus decolorationis]|uniref:DinB family protein n=1 Tax=Pseudalkalibacillus decolorationis TaxID=163879 RepID=UPI00214943D4|nr:DinB family protein [Pseudalkalibacillus decolorationis]
MKTMFEYNWMIRDQWFNWCQQVSNDELLRNRTGGIGGILETLFHIADVEYSWIQDLQGKPDFQEPFEKYNSLDQVIKLSESFHPIVEEFVNTWTDDMEDNILIPPWDLNRKYTYGEVLRHVIAHEIHHIGQLSVWARELDLKPVSANLIGKGLITIDLQH